MVTVQMCFSEPFSVVEIDTFWVKTVDDSNDFMDIGITKKYYNDHNCCPWLVHRGV